MYTAAAALGAALYGLFAGVFFGAHRHPTTTSDGNRMPGERDSPGLRHQEHLARGV
jgi:hypothetical protein